MADNSKFAILFETKTTDKGEKLADAIKALADKPGGLDDLMFYVNNHGNKWFEIFCEVTEIKKLLCLLVDDFNLVSCCPFWCTAYHSPEESKQYIREAIKEMRKDIAAVKNSRGC